MFNKIKNAVRKGFSAVVKKAKNLAYAVMAVIGFAAVDVSAEETTTTSVQMPEGVDLTGLLSSMATSLGAVVGAALAIWAGFRLVKLAKSWLASSVRG